MSVRSADPDTSVDAWASTFPHLSKERAVVLAAVERGGLIGFTAEQVVTVLAGWGIDRQRNCVASRLSELAKLGEIADTRLRRDGATGRPQIVWRRVRS